MAFLHFLLHFSCHQLAMEWLVDDMTRGYDIIHSSTKHIQYNAIVKVFCFHISYTFLLGDILLDVILLSVTMSNITRLSITWQIVILLSAILLSVILLSFILISVILLSALLLSVVLLVSFCLCHSA